MQSPNLIASFQDVVDRGLVSCRKHPTDDLWILNYTPECQFSKSWNDVTLRCRGLIVNAEGEVVARPFKKFFNLSEHDNSALPKVPHGLPFKAFEKCDGSLGISYVSSRGWEIATRGSFESEQAVKATHLLHTKYANLIPKLNPNWTYLFEIVYPENRIVVDYGKEEKLVLLGVIITLTGHEIPLLPTFADLGFPLPRVFEAEDLESLPRDIQNFEGYVVRFDNGMRVKVKLDDYVRLHKIMTGITPNRVWEMLAAGQDVRSFVVELPDEMYDEVMKVAEDIEAERRSLLHLHLVALHKLQLENLSRKEQASKILDLCRRSQNEPVLCDLVVPLNSSVLFLLLDNQVDVVKQKSWNLVKPKNGNKLICKADLQG